MGDWPCTEDRGLVCGDETPRTSLCRRRLFARRGERSLTVDGGVSNVFASKTPSGVATCCRDMVTGEAVEAEFDQVTGGGGRRGGLGLLR